MPELFQHDFMRLAALAIAIAMPLFALLGTMVVTNRLAFLADAIGHTTLTGIALGLLFGLGQPLLAMIGFALLFATAITWVRRRGGNSTDTVIAVFAASAVALGLVLLTLRGGLQRYAVYFTGDLLSITPGEIAILAGVAAAVAVFWLFAFNRILAVSISPTLAASRGMPVAATELLFTLLTAMVVMANIRWVGILVMSAMLIIPAAAARNVAATIRSYHRWSVAIALFSGFSGLVLSYYLRTATGPTIVLVAAACFLATLFLRPRTRVA
ncbi:MAG: metal ABC transporter permease [Spirochaetes bacterium]|nr:metal ABC transporter permease [Spirochaetota bacterium]